MATVNDPIVIAGYARTPMGGFQGSLGSVKATELGAIAVKAAVERAGVSPEAVDQIIMGCVLPAGLGQAPARQAGMGAGLPLSAEATTVNKMCGSGMQAAILAHDALAAGSADIIVAGGMESMSNAPYLLTKHRGGARIGHDRVADSMYLDGLEDAYEPGKLMGAFAEESAKDYQIGRAAMDAYAIESLARARAAVEGGRFYGEIVPVSVETRSGAVLVSDDEQPLKADPAKIPTLKPAFAKDGAITAANASSISDGAAALVITRASVAERLGMTPIARIAGHGPGPGHAQGAGARRLVARRCRPVRGQRGLRGGGDDRHARAFHSSRRPERQRRRLRAWASNRRLGRAYPGYPAGVAGGARRQTRRG
jgi:acetyl-CoA C-acetyltransferase